MALNRDDAEKIAKKLGAKFKKKTKAHDLWCVYSGKKVIARFGIRRGSNRDQGHDHIPRDIFETQHNAKMLALCPRSFEQWLANMDEKGKLPQEGQRTAAQ